MPRLSSRRWPGSRGEIKVRHRLRAVLILSAAASILLAVGWVAASVFQSPGQREADARPPAPEPLLEPVRQGTLADTTNVRGSIGFTNEVPVSIANLPERAVVTANTAPIGAVVHPGDAPLVVNGRPILVLPGTFSFYRDIGPGAEGPDVLQLQDALVAAGLPVRSSELGVYGPGTQEAVRRLYRNVGFAANETNVEAVPADQGPPSAVPVLPLSEIAAVATLPAVVTSTFGVGTILDTSEPVMTVATGALVARATLPSGVAARTTTGLTGTITANDGRTERGTVTEIGAITESDDPTEAAPSETTVIVATEVPLPAEWLGLDVLITINFAPASEAGLIVPSRAVSSTSDGRSHVSRARGSSGDLARVEVRELQVLAGESLVEPREEGALVAGDRVRVG